MKNKIKLLWKNRQWLIVLLPLIAIVVSSFFSVPPVVRQGFICVALIWFQFSLMLGFFY